MPVQRQISPIPSGRYYIWFPTDGTVGLTNWRQAMTAILRFFKHPDVHVEKTQSGDHWSFAIFNVKSDKLHWPYVAGYPDFAPRGAVESYQDTIQSPDPVPDLPDRMAAAIDKAGDKISKIEVPNVPSVGLGFVLGLAAVAGGFFLISRIPKLRKE